MSLAAMVLADRSDHLARFYDRWIEVVTLGRAGRARDMVLDQVSPGQRLLDLGCGTGTLAVAAARAGAQVVAIDRSPAMISLAREKATTAGVTVDFRIGDVAFPPLEGERFDVATATFVLGELSRDSAALVLRRAAEALQPGGRLVIADEVVPDALGARLLTGLARAVQWAVSFLVLEKLAPTHRHPWEKLLAGAGLEIVPARSFRSGSMAVLLGRRPAELPPGDLAVARLDEILPVGATRAVLRAAAWLDAPIPVRPGVYRIGCPGPASPVLLTGNFLSSVEAVRGGLAGGDAYLVVEDTEGWNVWCASDAGLFDAEKGAALLERYGLDALVDVRRIVVPRLGGRVRTRLAALSGWDVVVGPIEARDLPAFLSAGINPSMLSLERLYRLPERVRVAALTLLQLVVLLASLRLAPPAYRRPIGGFALFAGALLPLAHDVLPGRTGVVKASALGALAALTGVVTGRLRLGGGAAIITIAPLVGWVYQSSSPVVFWKRLWR